MDKILELRNFNRDEFVNKLSDKVFRSKNIEEYRQKVFKSMKKHREAMVRLAK